MKGEADRASAAPATSGSCRPGARQARRSKPLLAAALGSLAFLGFFASCAPTDADSSPGEREIGPATQTSTPPAALTATPPVSAGTPETSLAAVTPDGDLLRLIDATLRGSAGTFAVAVKDLENSHSALLNADQPVPAGSLYKMAVMWAAYDALEKGHLSLQEQLASQDRATALSVGEALQRMITVSDNRSGLLLGDRLGWRQTTALMAELGVGQTAVDRSPTVTSAGDMLHILERIYRGLGLSPRSTSTMLDFLLRQEINDRLPRYLPAGVPVAHKTGNLAGVVNDAGIVFAPGGPYIIVVLASDLTDMGEGAEVIARLSREVYDYFDRARAAGGS